jgi:hypothetical protein
MVSTTRQLTIAMVLAVAAGAAGSEIAGAEDRLAVLEFFGRPAGAYCSAAGPAMRSLQDELAGRAVLLEYDYDVFSSGRVDRWWASAGTASALPLVMVGSGFETSSGSVDYERIYRAMLVTELARQPGVDVSAFWRRDGNRVRAYVRVHNDAGRTLRAAEQAALWLVVWEESDIGVSHTWVRATERQPLPAEVDDGATVTATFDTAPLAGVSWSRLSCLVLVEDRRSAAGPYDMLGAAVAAAPELSSSPDELRLDGGRRSAQVQIDGPHVLSWTAEAEDPWLAVAPASGDGLPAELTVSLIPELVSPATVAGSIRVDAWGEGLSTSIVLEVEVAAVIRGGGLRPGP